MYFGELLAEVGFVFGAHPWFAFVSVFLFCSLWGSFLNVVVYRAPLDRSVVFPPSACTSCGCPLPWFDNIPILSYFLLGGRCRCCGSQYSIRYMLIEVWAGVWGVILAHHFGIFTWQCWYYFVFVLFCTCVFLTDLDHWVIPDQVNFFGVGVGFLGALFGPPRGEASWLIYDYHWRNLPSNLASAAAGAFMGWFFFYTIQQIGLILAKQEAMGGGDVKFAAAIGAFLGWEGAFVAFLLSFFLGSLVAVPLLMIRKGSGKDPIPFGTFMAIAAIPVAIWGLNGPDTLLDWSERLWSFTDMLSGWLHLH